MGGSGGGTPVWLSIVYSAQGNTMKRSKEATKQVERPVDPHAYWLEVILWGTSTPPTTPGGRG